MLSYCIGVWGGISQCTSRCTIFKHSYHMLSSSNNIQLLVFGSLTVDFSGILLSTDRAVSQRDIFVLFDVFFLQILPQRWFVHLFLLLYTCCCHFPVQYMRNIKVTDITVCLIKFYIIFKAEVPLSSKTSFQGKKKFKIYSTVFMFSFFFSEVEIYSLGRQTF